MQNFPNPVSSKTTIGFYLPKSSYVSLKVYDINGREAETLVNKQLREGFFSYDFNAEKLSTGLYYYQLKASNLIETKKMIVIK